MPKPRKNLHPKIVPETHEYRLIDLRSMSLPIPGAGVFDDPIRCYKLNNEWAKTILGFLTHLTENYVWDETTGDTQAALEAVIEFMIGEDCGMDCNEVDDCLDTIPDWIAITNLTYQNAVNAPETSAQELAAQYDGTPQSIASDMPVDTPDSQESNLLCYALHAFVGYWAATKAAEISLTNALQTAMNAILEAAKRIVGSNNLGLLGSILGDLTYGCAATVDDTLAALQDDGAIQQLSCYLYNAMRCDPFTKTLFDDTVAASALHDFANDNAQILACILNADNSDDVYRVFLFGYQTAHGLEDAGATLDCPCAGAYWILDTKFANGLGPWTLILGTLTAGRIVGEESGQALWSRVQLTLPAGCTLHRGRIWGERTQWTSFSIWSEQNFEFLRDPEADVLLGTGGPYLGPFVRCGFNLAGYPNVDTIRATALIDADENPPGQIYLDRVQFVGSGTMPSGAIPLSELNDCDGC